MGHGTSLMAPSNSRNAMTSPLRMRPVQRAGFEMSFAAVSEKIVMVGSVRDCWRSTQGRTAKMEFDNDAKIFCRVGKGALVPCPPCVTRVLLEMVGTRSLSSGAHSRDPLALPTLRIGDCYPYFTAFAPRGLLSRINLSRCMRMWAAS